MRKLFFSVIFFIGLSRVFSQGGIVYPSQNHVYLDFGDPNFEQPVKFSSPLPSNNLIWVNFVSKATGTAGMNLYYATQISPDSIVIQGMGHHPAMTAGNEYSIRLTVQDMNVGGQTYVYNDFMSVRVMNRHHLNVTYQGPPNYYNVDLVGDVVNNYYVTGSNVTWLHNGVLVPPLMPYITNSSIKSSINGGVQMGPGLHKLSASFKAYSNTFTPDTADMFVKLNYFIPFGPYNSYATFLQIGETVANASCSTYRAWGVQYQGFGLNNANDSVTLTVNFGDGTMQSFKQRYFGTPLGDLFYFDHNYNNVGNYTMQLILQDDQGGLADTLIYQANVISCGNVNGKIVRDVNANCTVNPGIDSLVANQTVVIKNATQTFLTFSDHLGYYSAQIPMGTYTISLGPISPGTIINCPGSLPHNITVSSSSITEDFVIDCAGIDLAVNNISITGPVFPGQIVFISPFSGIKNPYCNISQLNTLPGKLKVRIPICFTYLSPTAMAPAPSQISPGPNGDTLIWNTTNLYQLGNFNLQNHTFAASVCTTATFTDTLCIEAWVEPTVGDANPANNYFERCFSVLNSYDPNYKEVSPSGSGVNGLIPVTTNELMYTLHFQNTGNAAAYNIYLLDTLDANLDISTIQILSGSHTMQVYLLPGNVLKFNFPNIMLPDSTSDYFGSMGYVTYRVNLKSGLPVGTQIKNTGYIYFDYNPPVVTNTTINTLYSPVGITQQNKNTLNCSVYPNPAANRFYVSGLPSGKKEVTILDILGNVVEQKFIYSDQFSQETNSWPSGIYILKIGQEGKSLQKRIVISQD